MMFVVLRVVAPMSIMSEHCRFHQWLPVKTEEFTITTKSQVYKNFSNI